MARPGGFNWCAGLSCLFRFLIKTNEINQTNETNHMKEMIPARRGEMVQGIGSFSTDSSRGARSSNASIHFFGMVQCRWSSRCS